MPLNRAYGVFSTELHPVIFLSFYLSLFTLRALTRHLYYPVLSKAKLTREYSLGTFGPWATRIGYAYTAEIAAKYPDGVTQEVAEKEAIESMRPFNVKFKEVHWWTL